MPESPARPCSSYLPGTTLHEYQLHMKQQHPAMFELLDARRLTELEDQSWLADDNEFGDDNDRGRGSSYRLAQRRSTARLTGITTLFDLLGGPHWTRPVCDVLGGDGLLSKVWRGLTGAPADAEVPLLAGDISGRMVAAALADGLPAVRQRADRLLLRDTVLDAVLIAYGSHHIAAPARPDAVAEAYRVLAPGGRVALHDFAAGSPVARWFGEVVHHQALAGHDYDHFTSDEMRGYLTAAGFADVRVESMYDPVTVRGETPEQALAALADYMIDMYGLELLRGAAPTADAARADTLGLLREIFRYTPDEIPESATGAVTELTVVADGSGHRAELPRIALVASGTKR
ncbi:class I SAM-dependent methyltransferase [Saccharomonospora piscinae]|uniref:Methyltransferase n=1 Tax=Saccharomonospora piscinae TaxID=687388 RepID=W5VFJ8_SACPI|nr:methyltransferase domain-containing protein [Saccharomonospora piscinae]AHH53510.1 methyltransferase [Saccharomonospora piscinae]